MNDLTGAFLIAKRKKEDLLFTRQSLANAGYPIQEIEEAFMESNQLTSAINTAPINIIKKKKSYFWFLIIFLIILFAGAGIYLFLGNFKFGGN